MTILIINKKTMGRKQKLKLQRRIEEKNEFITRKERNNKLIISIIFLILILFAVWQISIALNKNENGEKENNFIEESSEKINDIKVEEENNEIED
ncbi:MAG: hypothetical protein KAS01_02585, partial [Candidatus Pacebacteria bacterium]|nr:hypothetical protein [Candidatus Paceibacterota bacterium]